MNASPSVEKKRVGTPADADAGWSAQLGRLPFHTKLAVISTGICLLCLMVAAGAMAAFQHQALAELLVNRAKTQAEVVAANSEAALSFMDRGAASLVLGNLEADPSIEEAQLRFLSSSGSEEPGDSLATYTRGGQPRALPDFAEDRTLREGDTLHLLQPVMQGGSPIGFLYLRVSLGELAVLRWRLLWLSGLLVLAVISLAWMLSRPLQGMVTRPVTELLHTTDAVRVSKDYTLRARVLANDELGRLTHAVNAMLAEVQAHDAARAMVETEIRDLNEQLEQKVRHRTQDLQASNLDLQEALASLRQTQTQLVESEKLAALGGLVAGVAHEINTPIGVCVTVASHLEESVLRMQRAYREGIRRSELEAFLEESHQAAEIINGNLRRAADLVRSFKQVAVDQGSEERRQFEAANYLAEVLRSVGPELRRQRIAVELDCPPGILLDSYPGVLAQIVTNLAINSRQHAFDGTSDAPRIQVRGRLEDGQFVMHFEDNGRGMTEEVRQHIFEPFFTTRRGSGGSGLGLHIVYNQVTKQLRGQISCDSEPGVGTRFVLRMPRVTPGRPEAPPPDMNLSQGGAPQG
ncbi:ATP-binding protein [Pseudomarimonas salicorniae]|uniref:histidine kinase n=1 Tax=Pseudomarimonas salicorniae TaxID=2933270 RepID=A0ABT0GFI5_9GAMM|nr:ATP-binding protein [Lysobacter sp. CAU 1642]MCK7593301.1 ATP-binding protein [Lysobacter sp. CAU 1642]